MYNTEEKNVLDGQVVQLQEYYQDKGLTIVGLNDSQGVNVSSNIFKRGILELIANALKAGELDPIIIDAFSMLMNKTEHVDYYLRHDLSVEEIKLSQNYSAIQAFSKLLKDMHLPQSLSGIASCYSFINKTGEKDKNVRVRSLLRDSFEPTIIYSSGVNNLMRELGTNPFVLPYDYKTREKRPNYYYTEDKAKDPSVLSKVIDGIESNFEHILSINDSADIYALGIYVPKSIRSDETNLYGNLVSSYDEKLEQLCSSYHVTYINMEQIGKSYNNNSLNFHISARGHSVIADTILHNMWARKIGYRTSSKGLVAHADEAGIGPWGVYKSLVKDIEGSQSLANNYTGYEKQRELDIAEEHLREAEVFKKVMQKTR